MQRKWLELCFSDFKVHISHLGICKKCWLDLVSSGVEPDILQIKQVRRLAQGPPTLRVAKHWSIIGKAFHHLVPLAWRLQPSPPCLYVSTSPHPLVLLYTSRSHYVGFPFSECVVLLHCSLPLPMLYLLPGPLFIFPCCLLVLQRSTTCHLPCKAFPDCRASCGFCFSGGT